MNTKNNNDRLILITSTHQDLSKFELYHKNEIKDLYSLIITGNTKATNTPLNQNSEACGTLKQYKNYINQMKHLIHAFEHLKVILV
jgi:hypothetical protein